MINFRTLLRQCLLAVLLAGSALGAMAGPLSFHVDVDASTLNGPGYLDFYFTKDAVAAAATVTVSNLARTAGDVAYAVGAVSLLPDGRIVIGNGPDIDNIFGQNVQFGGVFGFDLLFDTDFFNEAPGAGSTLSVSLLDLDSNPAAGTDYGVALFDLVPGAGIRHSTTEGFASITAIPASAVPEPSSLLVMMTGLGLAGLVARRRRQSATA